MPKSFTRSPDFRRASALTCGGRIVALLLVPCLVADPVANAFAFTSPFSPLGWESEPLFETEALSEQVAAANFTGATNAGQAHHVVVEKMRESAAAPPTKPSATSNERRVNPPGTDSPRIAQNSLPIAGAKPAAAAKRARRHLDAVRSLQALVKRVQDWNQSDVRMAFLEIPIRQVSRSLNILRRVDPRFKIPYDG